jgi:hypothetical protein
MGLSNPMTGLKALDTGLLIHSFFQVRFSKPKKTI